MDPAAVGELEHGEDGGIGDATAAVVGEVGNDAPVRTPLKKTKTLRFPSERAKQILIPHPLASTRRTLLFVSLKLKHLFTLIPN